MQELLELFIGQYLFNAVTFFPYWQGSEEEEEDCLGTGHWEKMRTGQCMWSNEFCSPKRLCCSENRHLFFCRHSAEIHPSRRRGELEPNWIEQILTFTTYYPHFCRVDHKYMGTMVLGVSKELGSFLQTLAAFFLMNTSLKWWHFGKFQFLPMQSFPNSGEHEGGEMFRVTEGRIKATCFPLWKLCVACVVTTFEKKRKLNLQ